MEIEQKNGMVVLRKAAVCDKQMDNRQPGPVYWTKTPAENSADTVNYHYPKGSWLRMEPKFTRLS